jgi:hypothetical protein
MAADRLKVEDIASYLAGNGWARNERGWRGASYWHYRDEFEVLVPARDGLGDADRRVREILACLSEVERRSVDDIASDIAQPLLDKQFFRTHPAGHESGYTSLTSGLQTLQGIRTILATATRTVLEGPHFVFPRAQPVGLSAVLRAAELGPSRAGSYEIELRLGAHVEASGPGGENVNGRVVMRQMFEAASAARSAVSTDRPAAFDDAVTAGVSADLCGGLSDLGGAQRGEAFEIFFRWGRALPLEPGIAGRPAIAFPPGSGALLRTAAQRIRGLAASGPARVTGIVEGLHNDAVGDDRWRIRVRGELRTEQTEPSQRVVWVRLGDQASYDAAILAHQRKSLIIVAGVLSSATGRIELIPNRPIEF